MVRGEAGAGGIEAQDGVAEGENGNCELFFDQRCLACEVSLGKVYISNGLRAPQDGIYELFPLVRRISHLDRVEALEKVEDGGP